MACAGGGRWIAMVWVLAIALWGLSGCTKRVPVRLADSGRIEARAVFVSMTDGTEYRFRWAEVQDSTLMGPYRIEEDVSRDGMVEIIEADREIPLPLSHVRGIEAKRFDIERTLFLAGGAAVVGYFLQTLLPEESAGEPSNGGGKPPPQK